MLLGRPLAVGALGILMTMAIASCSSRDQQSNSKASGSTAVFEKGKTYVVIWGLPRIGQEGSSVITVLEIGPGPWLKVRNERDVECYLNSDRIIFVSNVILPSSKTQPATASGS